MRGGDRADADLEHRAAIEADARGFGDGRDPAGGCKTAGLRDLDREHVGGRLRAKSNAVVRAVQRLVRHDRHDEARREPRHARAVRLGDRLLDEIAARILKPRDALARARLVPGLIDIDADAGAITQRLLDRGDMRDVSATASPCRSSA